MNDPTNHLSDHEPLLRVPTLGERALALAQAERVAHHPPRIALYLAAGTRNHAPLGLVAADWCAAFASWAVYAAASEEAVELGEPPPNVLAVATHWVPETFSVGVGAGALPIGYRVSVRELVEDARATKTWVDVAAMRLSGPERRRPTRGDLLVFGRAGEDPRAGGHGHVVLVEDDGRLDPSGEVLPVEDAWVVVSGNAPGGTIAREARTLADTVEPVVGFIEVRRGEERPMGWKEEEDANLARRQARIAEATRPLTEEEKRWMRRCRRTIDAKPVTLWVLGTDGALAVYMDTNGEAIVSVVSIVNPKVGAHG